ncbi:MAG: phage tail protein [Gammaproteobacteria bacterium]|nr:phage tail protein [Gammaproteobacteria bacterium]
MAEERFLRGYNFLFELEGERIGYFTEIGGMGVEVEVIEAREGGNESQVYTLPGLVRYPRITLSWGVTKSREMWEWLDGAVTGSVTKKGGAILYVDPSGQQEMVRYDLTNAWPCEWRGATLDALNSELAIERMTLVVERVERKAGAEAATEEAGEGAAA